MSVSNIPKPSFAAKAIAGLSRLSIHFKLAMLIALGFVVTFTVCFFLVTVNIRTIGLNFEAESEALIADLLVGQMQAPLQFKDSERLSEIFNPAVDNDSSLLRVEIIHVSGDILARYHTDSEHHAESEMSPELHRVIDDLFAEALDSKKRRQTFVGETYIVALPVMAKDGVNLLGVAGFAWDNGVYLKAQLTEILWTAIFSMLVALGGLIVIVRIISLMVTRPIGALSVAMEAVSDHDYTTEIPHTDRKDEIGVMATKLAGFRDALGSEAAKNKARQQEVALRQKLFHQLSESMSHLAAGHTDCPIDVAEFAELDRDHVEICDNFNDVLTNLRNMLSTIVSTAESVRTSARGLSEVAADQSKRSEAQAATLEESAAAIEELNNSVQKTTGLAADANEHIAGNKRLAAAGGEVVDKTVKAMRDIEDSSQQITAIIGVIDDIAFQTNLLALNAGVEAARAGESGRGFAVVASEVRALAQRASDSANEIKELILRSSEHVTEGSELANQAGSALSEIIDGVNHVSEMVSLIATGSSEQATNLAEIKESVTELDRVTQQNAAVIEESSAESRNLSHEAQRMTDALQQFNIGGAGGEHAAAAGLPVDGPTGWEAEIANAEEAAAQNPEPALVFTARARAGKAATGHQDDWHEF